MGLRKMADSPADSQEPVDNPSHKEHIGLSNWWEIKAALEMLGVGGQS